MSYQTPPPPQGQEPLGTPQSGQQPGQQGGYQYQPPQGSPYGGPPAPRTDETGMAVVAHLSALIAQVVSVGWLSFVGPLAVWFLYKDRSPFVRACAAGAFNFNLGMWLMSIAAWISLFTVVLIPLAIVLFIISTLGMFILHIVAAVKASHGEVFNYPFQLRVLS
jgi:uncharacterized Tic20 family protein